MDQVSLQVGPTPHYQQWCHLQAPVEVTDPSMAYCYNHGVREIPWKGMFLKCYFMFIWAILQLILKCDDRISKDDVDYLFSSKE